MELLLRVATQRLHDAALPLRKDGWDATVSIERAKRDEDYVYDVRLSIRIGHVLRIPDEAREALSR
jgi:hypothetical protein